MTSADGSGSADDTVKTRSVAPRLWSPGLTVLHNATTTSSVLNITCLLCCEALMQPCMQAGGKRSYNCALTWRIWSIF